MEIINEIEDRKRSIYSGAIGYFSSSGDMDTAIALRTAVIKDNKMYVQAGGGVVYDSGEEYELILIGPASKIKNLEDKIDIKIIGRVSDSKEPILEFYKNKKIINLSTEGFDHFG